MSARRCVVTAGPLTRPRRCTRRGGPPRPPASGRGDGIPYPPASGRRGGPLRPPATIHRVNRSTDHAPAIHAHATPTKPPTGASQLSAQTVGHAVPATPCLNRSHALSIHAHATPKQSPARGGPTISPGCQPWENNPPIQPEPCKGGSTPHLAPHPIRPTRATRPSRTYPNRRGGPLRPPNSRPPARRPLLVASPSYQPRSGALILARGANPGNTLAPPYSSGGLGLAALAASPRPRSVFLLLTPLPGAHAPGYY